MTGIPADQILADLDDALAEVDPDELAGWLRGYVAAARSTPPVAKKAARKATAKTTTG